MAEETTTVHFVLLEPAHEDLIQIFECQTCKEKTGAAGMLPHAIEHGAAKVTVDTMTALRRHHEHQV